jgi:hypothetical protein
VDQLQAVIRDNTRNKARNSEKQLKKLLMAMTPRRMRSAVVD